MIEVTDLVITAVGREAMANMVKGTSTLQISDFQIAKSGGVLVIYRET